MKTRLTVLAIAAVFGTSLYAFQGAQPQTPTPRRRPPAKVPAGRAPAGRAVGAAAAVAEDAERRIRMPSTSTSGPGRRRTAKGMHDYPQLLADWSKNQGEGLAMRGAIVDGALHPPTAGELANTDVIVDVQGRRRGHMTPQQHADLENYIKRGGGFVSFHDSLCVADTEWWANTVTGGAKKHGETELLAGHAAHHDRRQGQPDHGRHEGLRYAGRGVHADDVGEDADSSAGDRRRCPAARTRTKSCRRSGPTSTRCPADSRRARSCGCRATSTRNFSDPKI